jgi:cytolysin (calcineurin-like family phosphatase)
LYIFALFGWNTFLNTRFLGAGRTIEFDDFVDDGDGVGHGERTNFEEKKPEPVIVFQILLYNSSGIYDQSMTNHHHASLQSLQPTFKMQKRPF